VGWKRVTLRLPRGLYIKVYLKAQDEGISRNLLLERVLDDYTRRRVAERNTQQKVWQAAHPGACEFDGPFYRSAGQSVPHLDTETGEVALLRRHMAVPRRELVGAHRLVLRLPEAIYDGLRVCASWDGITTSRLMTWVLEDYL
jgi:hypothetical protein